MIANPARPQLIVKLPASYGPEREYIVDVILNHFLGIDYLIEWEQRVDLCIVDADGKRRLLLSDGLFATPGEHWLTKSSLPAQPVDCWRVPKEIGKLWPLQEDLPVIYGRGTGEPSCFEWHSDFVRLDLDIFGAAFFMLTRYEEVVQAKYDEYGRFLATDALAFQEGFLHRPIVNEYVELLWLAMERLWPQLTRKKRNFGVVPTHDVDHPFRLQPLTRCMRTALGDVINRRSAALAANSIYHGASASMGLSHSDRFDTFDWLMRLSEEHNCKSAFYFLTHRNYSLHSRGVRNLLRRIGSRGHEIGIHPHLGTQRDAGSLEQEVTRLRYVLDQEGLDEVIAGGRQHYLSWEAPTTWQLWDDAGLSYDCTLGFADCAGFRCGTCYEYPVFNLLTSKRLRLIERPLLVMECSLFSPQYMGLDYMAAFDRVRTIYDHTRRYDGEFQILWHNNWFDGSQREIEFYEAVIRLAAA